jgi:hypothetical protein
MMQLIEITPGYWINPKYVVSVEKAGAAPDGSSQFTLAMLASHRTVPLPGNASGVVNKLEDPRR